MIVVYKVDRLTRSLADFAKLVELFDAHDVSFISVTQAFLDAMIRAIAVNGLDPCISDRFAFADAPRAEQWRAAPARR